MYHNQCKYLRESIQGKFYQAEVATYYLMLVLITYQITDLQCDYFIYFINEFLINVFFDFEVLPVVYELTIINHT